jgi:hypothetical protein
LNWSYKEGVEGSLAVKGGLRLQWLSSWSTAHWKVTRRMIEAVQRKDLSPSQGRISDKREVVTCESQCAAKLLALASRMPRRQCFLLRVLINLTARFTSPLTNVFGESLFAAYVDSLQQR